MIKLFSAERNIQIVNSLPIVLNAILIAIGVFILLTMSVVWGVFEEFTAFTDYTQDWIEFNFFVHYWDRLTISRVYLAFIFIYGAVILAIAAAQVHGYRKNDLSLMYFAPFLLVFVASVTMLASIIWLIVTAVNHNEGFLASGGFIFERMRFRGNVWKDLKYREQSWKLVTSNQVPIKAPILQTWVHQRERDFECCGWDSYLDYKNNGGFTELPESCCKRKSRGYRCGSNYLIEDITSRLNTRGCKKVMYDWYRRGFGTNVAIAILGIILASYEFVLYSLNRRKYFKTVSQMMEFTKLKETARISRANSKASVNVPSTPAQVEVGANTDRPRVPLRIPMRNFYNRVDENDNGDEVQQTTVFDQDPSTSYSSRMPRAYDNRVGGQEERKPLYK